ncbi:MAG: hypothetical protein IH972_01575 [Candidatus Marinimicrobia bacterium]|nr:hypothetical protein [Candidatus Neomarinimicrobiota bacterium]
MAAWLLGCASTRDTSRDHEYYPYHPAQVKLEKYRSVQERHDHQQKDLAIAMAVSGGGLRAANFGLGVMVELSKFERNGDTFNILREIDRRRGFLSTNMRRFVRIGRLAAAAVVLLAFLGIAAAQRYSPDTFRMKDQPHPVASVVEHSGSAAVRGCEQLVAIPRGFREAFSPVTDEVHRVTKQRKYFDAAIQAANWIDSLEVRKGDRSTWPMNDEKNIFPNVDYPCGLTYFLLDLPLDLYTPLFVASRVTGWSAHFIEQSMDNRIYRPLSIYVGEAERPVTSMSER